jgi:endonuclease/exonuclease/phosphatase family metal-dependent hydrolase
VDACASLAADVLCLQEVDRHQPRSGHTDQTAEVARALGATAWRFEPALIGEPGGQWRPATGADATDAPTGATGDRPPAYGVGIVGKLPVRRWRVVRLGGAGIRAPVAVPGTRRLILVRDEPRVALAAEIDGPTGPLVVATTHLSFVPGWNAVQLRRVARALASPAHPSVLLGDLNLPGPTPAWVSGWRPLVRAPTFPADDPRWQLDHVLGHGELPEVVAVATPELALSDHRGLVVDLAWSR